MGILVALALLPQIFGLRLGFLTEEARETPGKVLAGDDGMPPQETFGNHVPQPSKSIRYTSYGNTPELPPQYWVASR